MILSCGEALIDMLPRKSTEGEEAFAPHAGGAVFNTAIALGRLGAPSGFLTGLSNDLFGTILADALRESNVDFDLSVRSDRPTTLAFVALKDGQASYAFYDENTAGRMLRAEDLPTLPPSVGALFFGGISLVNEPAAAAYEALMTREAPSRVTMIDPNIRPGFIRDEERYRARIDRMIALADIVKLSDEDLAWLRGNGAGSDGEGSAEGRIEEMARGILAEGPAVVVVTRGGDGALGFSAEHRVSVAARQVEVVDTVGAGDTFNAGILAALHRRGMLTRAAIGSIDAESLSAALDLGMRAAAVTVSRAGANPPWARELD